MNTERYEKIYTEMKYETDIASMEQIINPDDYKDTSLLANRQSRRNIIDDAEGDVEMGNADQEVAAETRPTKTVTNDVAVKVCTSKYEVKH